MGKTYWLSAKIRYNGGKKFALKTGREWSINFKTYEALIERPCTYCGGTLRHQSGYSLDRIDNRYGYTPDNVLPCCGICNKIRGPYLTVDEMRVAMRAVLDLRKSEIHRILSDQLSETIE